MWFVDLLLYFFECNFTGTVCGYYSLWLFLHNISLLCVERLWCARARALLYKSIHSLCVRVWLELFSWTIEFFRTHTHTLNTHKMRKHVDLCIVIFIYYIWIYRTHLIWFFFLLTFNLLKKILALKLVESFLNLSFTHCMHCIYFFHSIQFFAFLCLKCVSIQKCVCVCAFLTYSWWAQVRAHAKPHTLAHSFIYYIPSEKTSSNGSDRNLLW